MPGLASACRTIALVATGFALLACDPVDYSDQGIYRFKTGLSQPLGTRTRHILVGSALAIELAGLGSTNAELDPEQGGLGCASLGASGVLIDEGDQFRVSGPGPGALVIGDPAINCPANTDALATSGPDQWTIEGVPGSALAGRWAPSPGSELVDLDYSPGPAGPFPDDLAGPLNPLRVVAGGRFTALPALVLAEDPSVEVRWADEARELVVPGRYDELRPSFEREGEIRRSPYLSGSLATGEGFDSSLEILGTKVALPPVETVDVDRISTLELVVAYESSIPGEPREWGVPIGAVALTYDSEGRRVVGAPVEFTLTRGRLAVYGGEDASDFTVLEDKCSPHVEEPTFRGATLEARIGDLVDRVDLEWIALPYDDPNRDDLSDCQGSVPACDCRSIDPDDAPAPGLALLALLGIGLGRHRSRRRAASTLAT